MCFGAREDVEAKRSREIDALIHRDEKVMQKVVKLLLLGMHLGRQRQYQSAYG
jgi:guanine nucleotide-binding protein subunit alpha, other